MLWALFVVVTATTSPPSRRGERPVEADLLEEGLLLGVEAVGQEAPLVDHRTEDLGDPSGAGEVAGGQSLERATTGLLQEVLADVPIPEREVLLAEQDVGRIVDGEGRRVALDGDGPGEGEQRLEGDRVDQDHAVQLLTARLGVDLRDDLGHRREVGGHGDVAGLDPWREAPVAGHEVGRRGWGGDRGVHGAQRALERGDLVGTGQVEVAVVGR